MLSFGGGGGGGEEDHFEKKKFPLLCSDKPPMKKTKCFVCF